MTFDDIATLPVDWSVEDGHASPVPSAAAIAAARACLADISRLDVVCDVDADVMGGVGITLYGSARGRSVWIALGNNGANTVIYGGGGTGLPDGERLNAASLAKAIDWVNPSPPTAVSPAR